MCVCACACVRVRVCVCVCALATHPRALVNFCQPACARACARVYCLCARVNSARRRGGRQAVGSIVAAWFGGYLLKFMTDRQVNVNIDNNSNNI